MTGDQHFAIVMGVVALLAFCGEAIRDSIQATSSGCTLRAVFEAFTAAGLFVTAIILCGVYK